MSTVADKFVMSPEPQVKFEVWVTFCEGKKDMVQTLKPNTCATCGSKYVRAQDFRDKLSRKEYEISKMCQICQDEVFGVTIRLLT